MKRAITSIIFLAASAVFMQSSTLNAEIIIDFEELTLFTADNPTGSGQFYNGNDGSNITNSNGWSSQDVFFGNSFNSDWGSWNGFAYSSVVDTVTPGFTNQYAAFVDDIPKGGGAGVEGSHIYAVVCAGAHAFFNLPVLSYVNSVYVTNTTYAALSMLNGDQFAKQFGGPSGDDPDWFRVTFTGFSAADAQGTITGSKEFYLADYRFEDNSLNYIISSWSRVNLRSLGALRSVGITLESSDTDPIWGMNTPAYVAIDNLSFSVVPEPSSATLLLAAGLPMIVQRKRRCI